MLSVAVHADTDKREDTETLRQSGADDRLIARIFLFEGRLISVFGAIAGLYWGCCCVSCNNASDLYRWAAATEVL